MPQSKSPKYNIALSYFKGVLANERRIQCFESEIGVQQSRLTLSGAEGGEVVNKTMEGDSMGEGFSRLYELCDSLDDELISYVGERERAIALLNELPNADMIDIVYRRYFMGMPFKDIHRMMVLERRDRGDSSGISERSMYSLHEQAMYILYAHIRKLQ